MITIILDDSTTENTVDDIINSIYNSREDIDNLLIPMIVNHPMVKIVVNNIDYDVIEPLILEEVKFNILNRFVTSVANYNLVLLSNIESYLIKTTEGEYLEKDIHLLREILETFDDSPLDVFVNVTEEFKNNQQVRDMLEYFE